MRVRAGKNGIISNVFGWIDGGETGVELIVRVAASDVIKIIVIVIVVVVGRCHRQAVRFVCLCSHNGSKVNYQVFIRQENSHITIKLHLQGSIKMAKSLIYNSLP